MTHPGTIVNLGTYQGKVIGDGDIALVLSVPLDKKGSLPAFVKDIGPRLASVHYMYPELLPVGKTKAPLKSLRTAWERVQREIKTLCPQVKRIAVLGGTDVLRVLVPKLKGDIQDAHGTLFSIGDWVVVPLFPVNWAHQQQWQDKDVKRLLKLERPSEPLPHKSWLPNTFAGVDTLVIDVETDGESKGPDVSTHSLTSMGLQWSDTERAIITDHDVMSWVIKMVAESPPDNVVMHNAQYDLTFMGPEFRAATYGRIRDTMLRARSRGEHVATLKHLGVYYTRSPGNYAWAVAGQQHNYDDPAYICEDLDITWRLFKLWRNENTQSVELYEKCSTMMTEQSVAGTAIDMSMLDTIAVEGKQLEQELKAALTEKYGCDPGSDDLIPALESKGHKFGSFTKTGAVSLTAAVLESMGLDDIIEWRKAQKLDSAFVGKIKDLLRPDNTLPHHQKLCEADTGRTSMTSFNWQQAGRKGPVRKLLVSRFEGGSVASADLSQAELRGACYGANDAVFAAALNAKDMHRENAALAFNKLPDDISDDERTDAKTVVFRLIFGGSAQNDGQRAVEASFKQRFPKLMKWLDAQKSTAERLGQCVSAWGKVRKLDEVLDYRGRWAVGRAGVNAPIQGIASDFALWLTVRVWELMRSNGLKSLVLMGIHDAVLFDIFPGEYETVAQLLRVAFAQLGALLRQQFPIASVLPITAEMQVADNWADTKSGEKLMFSTNEGMDV